MTAYADPFAMIVRVLARAGNDSPAGFGFVLADRHIVTCAHVVNTALGRDRRAQEPPPADAVIDLDFPLLGGVAGPLRRVRVERWSAPPPSGVAGGDVAGLVLIGEGLPGGVVPAPLADIERAAGQDVLVFGQPRQPRRSDVWTKCRLLGRVTGGLIQLEPVAESLFRPQSGFSGSPVWDPLAQRVVGMLSAADAEVGDAYAIPHELLAATWPDVLDRSVPPCPYRELHAFTLQDREFFVGRERETESLVEAFDRDRLVAVVGPSGVGKSSLVHAGLVPVLLDRGGWVLVTFHPRADPFERLAAALVRLELGTDVVPLDKIRIRADELYRRGTADLLRQLSIAMDRRVLVVADQFEELLVADIDEGRRERFLDVLLTVPGRSGPPTDHGVVLTVRADFFPALLDRPGVGGRLQGRDILVSPMTRDVLSRVIVEPARRQGVEYTWGLAEHIAREASAGLGALPLLEFTLTQLWIRQRGRRITEYEYQAIGGVTGSLDRYAEQVVANMRKAGHSDERQLRRVLLSLVRTGGQTGKALRRVVRRDDLRPEDWLVVQSLAEARLVVLGAEHARRVETAEVAHEALIVGWSRLAQWAADEADFLRWRSLMEDRLAEGEALSDSRLAEADAWLEQRPDDVPDDVRRLVEASHDEQQRRIRALQEAHARAEANAGRADALRLAAQAELARMSPDVSSPVVLAVAIESVRRTPTLEGDLALRRALAETAHPVGRLDQEMPVSALAFSPDGTLVATAGIDGTARLFRVDSGAHLARLDHDGPVHAVTFSPNGTRIATASADGTRLFSTDGSLDPSGARADDTEVISGGAVETHLDSLGPVYAVAFNPAGTQIATASADGAARLFSLGFGSPTPQAVLLSTFDHDGPVYTVAFSPDGTRIATAGADGSARVFQVNGVDGGEPETRLDHDGPVHAVAFSPDGAYLASASADGSARLFHLVADASVARLDHDGPVVGIAFSPDGSRFATASDDGTARVFRADSGRMIVRTEHDGPVQAVAFSPDGTRIATACADGGTRLFRADSGAPLARLEHRGPVQALAFSPDGSRVAGADGTARLFLADSGAPLARLEHRGPVQALAFSPDSTRLATGGVDGTARLFHTNGGAQLARLEHRGAVQAVAFSPDGTRLATASADGSARLFRVGDGGPLLARLEHGGPLHAVAFSPDGTRLATASADGTARLFRTGSRVLLARLVHDGPVYALAFSPDGTRITTASADGSARVFRSDGGTILARLEHGGPVRAVTFSPDGTRIATASADSTARLSKIGEDGAHTTTLDHDGPVHAVAFSPDGTRIATACDDGTARLFDTESREPLARLDHDGPVRAVAFSPSGTRLVTAGDDGACCIWAVSIQLLLEQAEARLTRPLTMSERRRYLMM